MRRCRISCLLGLTSEQTLKQERILFFQANNFSLIQLTFVEHLPKHLLEQHGIIWKIFGQGIHALDYTESGYESRRQNLMRTVAPEVKAIEHPVEFLDGQNDRLVGGVGRCFESFGLEALELKAEAVALPI